MATKPKEITELNRRQWERYICNSLLVTYYMKQGMRRVFQCNWRQAAYVFKQYTQLYAILALFSNVKILPRNGVCVWQTPPITKHAQVNWGVCSLMRKPTNGAGLEREWTSEEKKKAFLMTEIKMESGCRRDLHLSTPSISLEMKTFRRCIVICHLVSTKPAPSRQLSSASFKNQFSKSLWRGCVQCSKTVRCSGTCSKIQTIRTRQFYVCSILDVHHFNQIQGGIFFNSLTVYLSNRIIRQLNWTSEHLADVLHKFICVKTHTWAHSHLIFFQWARITDHF